MEKVISRDGTPSLAKALASHFTVYHYDRRGRGDSGNGFDFDLQREIEDLDAVALASEPAPAKELALQR